MHVMKNDKGQIIDFVNVNSNLINDEGPLESPRRLSAICHESKLMQS